MRRKGTLAGVQAQHVGTEKGQAPRAGLGELGGMGFYRGQEGCLGRYAQQIGEERDTVVTC